jgi:cell division protein FtsW (lipid II flippase)
MPQLLENLTSNPLYIAIAVVIVLILLYVVMKRIIKLVIFVFILLLAFLAYVHFTGGNVNDAIDKVKGKGEELVK